MTIAGRKNTHFRPVDISLPLIQSLIALYNYIVVLLNNQVALIEKNDVSNPVAAPNLLTDPQALESIAAYFRALGDPTRLLLLQILRSGERRVGDLAQEANCGQANVSKHLQVLMNQGLVNRRHHGTSAYFSLSGQAPFMMCEAVCSEVSKVLESRASVATGLTLGGLQSRAPLKT